MSAFKEKYKNEVVPALMEKFKYRNIMEVPRLEKIVVNMGVGEGSRAPKLLDAAAHDLALITGQKAIITKAKKSIAAFKVRTGMPVGCRVTLRGERMYDFFSRLINVTLPRLRDFRGVSAKSYDKVEHVQGMDITVVTTAKSDEEAKELLAAFGMPFKD
jgi:large subunit ribosomal protein L5